MIDKELNGFYIQYSQVTDVKVVIVTTVLEERG